MCMMLAVAIAATFYLSAQPTSVLLQAVVIYLFRTVIVCMCHGCKVYYLLSIIRKKLFNVIPAIIPSHSLTLYRRFCSTQLFLLRFTLFMFSMQQNICRFRKFVSGVCHHLVLVLCLCKMLIVLPCNTTDQLFHSTNFLESTQNQNQNPPHFTFFIIFYPLNAYSSQYNLIV